MQWLQFWLRLVRLSNPRLLAGVVKTTVLIAGCLVAMAGIARAQGCCSAGGGAAQIGLFRQSQLFSGQGTLAFYYGQVRATQSYLGSRVIDDPQARAARRRSVTVAFGIGLPEGLSFQAAVPVVWRERSFKTSFAGVSTPVEFNGSGVGDPIVALLARLTPVFGFKGWQISAGMGLQIPIGEDEQRKGGVRQPNDVQPASGAWNIFFLESVSRSSGDWLFFHHFVYTLTRKNTIGYKLGNSVRTDIGGSVLLRGPLEPFLRMDLLYTRPDQIRDRFQPLSSTEAIRLYAVPGLALNLKAQRILLSAELGFPVYQNYSGNQLGTGRNWLVGLSYLL